MEFLGKKESQIRCKAAQLKLRQNKDSDFFKNWQTRAALSKIGKKRGKMKNNGVKITLEMINDIKNNIKHGEFIKKYTEVSQAIYYKIKNELLYWDLKLNGVIQL